MLIRLADESLFVFFFFQAEAAIRDLSGTEVEACAFPFSGRAGDPAAGGRHRHAARADERSGDDGARSGGGCGIAARGEIGRASCRGRVEISGGGVFLKKKTERICKMTYDRADRAIECSDR